MSNNDTSKVRWPWVIWLSLPWCVVGMLAESLQTGMAREVPPAEGSLRTYTQFLSALMGMGFTALVWGLVLRQDCRPSPLVWARGFWMVLSLLLVLALGVQLGLSPGSLYWTVPATAAALAAVCFAEWQWGFGLQPQERLGGLLVRSAFFAVGAQGVSTGLTALRMFAPKAVILGGGLQIYLAVGLGFSLVVFGAYLLPSAAVRKFLRDPAVPLVPGVPALGFWRRLLGDRAWVWYGLFLAPVVAGLSNHNLLLLALREQLGMAPGWIFMHFPSPGQLLAVVLLLVLAGSFAVGRRRPWRMNLAIAAALSALGGVCWLPLNPDPYFSAMTQALGTGLVLVALIHLTARLLMQSLPAAGAPLPYLLIAGVLQVGQGLFAELALHRPWQLDPGAVPALGGG